jgi:putative endonuclease
MSAMGGKRARPKPSRGTRKPAAPVGQRKFVIPAKAGTQLSQELMRDDFQPCVCLLASKRNGTLYVGATSNLLGRAYQHRVGAVRGFTRDYGVKLLVWFEQHPTMDSAITREKRIKKWNRVEAGTD